MYVKIINPSTHGKKVYANRGSARRATNYLQQEAREHGQAAAFFSSSVHGSITADEVVVRLDANHRGLRGEEAKFYSLVLSPGAEDLQKLGKDESTLVDFTRQAMNQYAQNFTQFQAGGEREETDLVWAAIIHRQRKNRGTEEGKQGELKSGPQTHVHVIVSARDATQQVTLNPLTTPARFNRVDYEAKVCVDFTECLGATSAVITNAATATRGQRVTEKAQDIRARAAANRQPKILTPAQLQAKEERLDVQVTRLNTKLAERNQLDAQRVKAAAQERGKFTPDPHEYLCTGLVQRGLAVRPPLVAPSPAVAPTELARPVRSQLPAGWQLLTQAAPASWPAMPAVVREPVVRSPEVMRLPMAVALSVNTPAVESPVLAARPLVPAGEVLSPAPLPLPTPLTLPRQVPVGELSAVEQLGGDPARLAAAARVRQQIDADALTAGQHTVGSASLLADQGLVPSAATQPDGMRYQADGELLRPTGVPMPAPQAAEANSLIQYGRIVLVDEPGQPAAERLEKWRPYLAAVGVTADQIRPATTSEPAHLSYSFDVQQADLDRVADRLNKLQNVPAARVYEALHALHTSVDGAAGLTMASAHWPERRGQFSQASFVVTGTSPERVAAQAERIRAELSRLGATVSAATPAGPGELEWGVTYHTRSSHIGELHATLEGAAWIEGVTLRESEAQQSARLVGVQRQEEKKQEIPGFQYER